MSAPAPATPAVAPPPMDLPSVVRLAELADYVVPLILRAVADLGVADLLVAGPRPAAELAGELGVHAGTLLRALRALASKGVFTEVSPGVFGLTALAAPLRADHPLSLREAYPLLPSDLRAWAMLGHTLRTGEPGFDAAHGEDYWTYLAGHPEESVRVDGWMRSVNRLHLRTVLPGHDWSRLSTVVDLGGGNGAFLAGLLRRYPGLRGHLVDLPHVVAGAPAVLAEAGVAGRCEITAGNIFDPVPAGADGYVLKTVLPGFGDADVVRILTRVRAAMRPDSELLLLEAVLPPGDAPDVAKLFDVHTLVLSGGAHRDPAATGALLARAGLRLDRVTPTPTLTVLRAVPAT